MTASPSSWKYKIPNILTLGRIILIPVLIVGILKLGDGWQSNSNLLIAVMGLFMLVCATDYWDGVLARRWGTTTDFGRMIDPIADKLLIAGCLIAICIVVDGHWVILVPSLAIIARDFLVSGAREHAALQSRAMPPTSLAKWKTAAEMMAIYILIYWIGSGSWNMLEHISNNHWAGYAGLAFLWLAAILSLYTGTLYVRASLREKA